jgi:hypothetical protein
MVAVVFFPPGVMGLTDQETHPKRRGRRAQWVVRTNTANRIADARAADTSEWVDELLLSPSNSEVFLDALHCTV